MFSIKEVVKKEIIDRFSDPLILNGFFLMIASIGAAPINFIFWTIMANAYPETEIGLATSLIALCVWLALFSRFGLEEGLRRFLPDYYRSRSDLIVSATIIVLISSLTIGSVFFGLVFALSSEYSLIEGKLFFIVVLISLVTANDISSLLGATFAGQSKSFLVFLRTILVVSIKIPLCLLLVNLGTLGLILGTSLAIWIVSLPLWKFGLPFAVEKFNLKLKVNLSNIFEMSQFSLGNYLANLIALLPRSFLPLIVLELLSSEHSAYFYIAWMISSMILVIPESLGASFMIEVAGIKTSRSDGLKKVIILLTVLIIPAILGIFLFGELLLQLFGPNYAQNGYELLLILTLTSIPATINTLFIFHYRLKKKTLPILFINAFIVLLTMGGSLIFIPHYGIISTGITFLGSHIIISICLLLSLCIHQLKKNLYSSKKITH